MNMATLKHSMSRDESIARDLANDMVHYLTGGTMQSKSIKPMQNKYSDTLRRNVDMVIEKNKAMFTKFIEELSFFSEGSVPEVKDAIEKIANEVFGDGKFNWGRLIVLYAFTGILAKYYAEHGKETYVEHVAKCIGDYVAEHLVNKIEENGGWKEFEETYSIKVKTDSSILNVVIIILIAIIIAYFLNWLI